MEKYSRAGIEVYSQSKQRKARLLEKYVGRLANYYGNKLEVVGYSTDTRIAAMLILDASTDGGWTFLSPADVVFRNCESYYYVGIDDLID